MSNIKNVTITTLPPCIKDNSSIPPLEKIPQNKNDVSKYHFFPMPQNSHLQFTKMMLY